MSILIAFVSHDYYSVESMKVLLTVGCCLKEKTHFIKDFDNIGFFFSKSTWKLLRNGCQWLFLFC